MDAETSPKPSLSPAGTAGVWCFDVFEVDLQRGELRSGGREIALRPKTFALLSHLVAHPGRLISKDELLGAVWPGVVVTEDSVIQRIGELRATLGGRGPQLIKTVPRRGYLFDTVVAPAAGAGAAAVPYAAAGTVAEQVPRRRRRVVLVAAGAAAALVVAASGAWWRASHPLHIDAAIAAERTVAVLPFADLSEPPSPAFAEAVVEDLGAAIARLPDTLVFASASTSGFTGSNHPKARRLGD